MKMVLFLLLLDRVDLTIRIVEMIEFVPLFINM